MTEQSRGHGLEWLLIALIYLLCGVEMFLASYFQGFGTLSLIVEIIHIGLYLGTAYYPIFMRSDSLVATKVLLLLFPAFLFVLLMFYPG